MTLPNGFNVLAAKRRCNAYRRRVIDMTQTVPALHVGGAFSCLELVDTIYSGLMRDGDTFILSKGHGAVAQYVVTDGLGILPKGELEKYCTKEGQLGMHPDYGVQGIAASTGSLGHGLSLGLGMALAERTIAMKSGAAPKVIYVVLSDGELQEGSTWEAILMASSLGVTNLVAMVDNNDFQSVGRTSVTHPSLYPMGAKFDTFGWEAVELDGHDQGALFEAVTARKGDRPFAVVARTVKGKGVSYMENVPMWHYRSPNKEEYAQAMRELAESDQ